MKTVIIYATKYGSAENAAELLKKRLGGRVKLINIVKELVPPLNEYDTVILGGSIYAGNIQTKLGEFMNYNLDILLQKRVGLFLCAAHPDPEVREKELAASFPPASRPNCIIML